LNTEIEKHRRLKSGQINTYTWYNQLFPESRSGNIVPSLIYYESLEDINDEIARSNKVFSPQSQEILNFKHHQHRIREPFKVIGINTSTMHRSDYMEVERAALEVIEAVNAMFGVKFNLTKPEY